jgi:transcriptional regulator with XRE-family HTH domain
MKSPAERGPIGAWAQEARDDAGLSVSEVVARLAARGHATTDSTIRGIEGGSKRPGRRLLRLLGEIYGRSIPGEALPPAEPTAALIAALQAQTDAITALVGEMRLARTG